ncbi:MAG: gliding motility-associated C-terminal domain-containing protein [Bacteroidia bacterium]
MKITSVFIVLLLLSSLCYSQRGKDGAKTVTATGTIVNEYTHLTANAASGATSITVAANTLNANARFGGALVPGDLIMIYQAQGAKLNGAVLGIAGVPNDSSWGAVVNYENCGLYEFQEVSSVAGANTINLDCGLTNSYSDTGMVQVVRVPRYASLTINAAGVMTAQTWNGVNGEGGILAVEVKGNTTITGKMDVTGLGFRGGALLDNNSNYGGGFYAAMNSGEGEDKGESIAGYEARYDPLGGHRSNGAPANGGGGGRCHNGGGGGGANGGLTNPPGVWDGKGHPDATVATYVTAWNLESPGFATHTSIGGGRGGYSFASNSANPTTVGPNNATWGGDNRKITGGLGGRPLDYSAGRLFFGGGGGAGDQDNSFGGAGGNGGGIIYLMNYGTVSGTGQLNANGNNGGNTPSNSIFNNSSDGAGGAGGGGVIIVNSVGAVTGTFTASANGGLGGNQVVVSSTTESEGPGGGGGGGYIAFSSGAITQTAGGGAGGSTNTGSMNQTGKKFIWNGATKGAAGLTAQPITNFNIATKTDTICAGQTGVLTATLSGTVPGGTVIMWYTAPTGGVAVGTGSPFTTPVINTTTVYYAGTCPGTFRVADTVKVTPAPTASAGSNVTICNGASTVLTATGGATYSWSPATGLTTTNTASTTASPATTTTYTVTVSSGGSCSSTATVTVTIGSPFTPTASASPSSICAGKTSALSAGGANTYSWSPATGLSSTTIPNPTATPTATTVYTVTAKDLSGCTATATTTVTVNTRPTANAGSNTAECKGSSTSLNASGGGTYSWSPSTGLSSTTVANPTVTTNNTTTYTVTIVDGNGCRDSAQVVLTVNPKPAVSAGTATSICTGGNVNLQATGANTYSWTPSTGLSSTTIANPVASPPSTITYTVTGTDLNGCVNSDTVTVSVGGSMTINVTGNNTICSGSSTILTATGAATYTWSPNSGISSVSASNPTFNPVSTTTYTVNGTSASGCAGSNTVTVTVNPNPTANAGSAVAYCQGGSTVLNGSGGGTYSWSPGTGLSSTAVSNPTANPAATITYTLTVTDANTCSNAATVTVTVNPLPTVTVSGNLSVCKGSGTVLTAAGASTYTWSPATGLSSTTSVSPASSPSSNTTYTVTGTDANNCVNSATVSVVVHSNPGVNVTASTTSACTPFCTTFTGMDSSGTCSTVLYNYGDGNTGSSPMHCYSVSGIFSVSFACTDVNGCSGTITKPNFIQALPSPEAAITVSPGTLITYAGNKPDSICITDASTGSPNSWMWNLGNGSNSSMQNPGCVTYADSGVYCIKLVILNSAGCSDTSQTCIHIEKLTEVSYTIPNIFSPNGDGQNDFFFIKNAGLKSLDCKIYDRWGVQMSTFNSLTGIWDGKTSQGAAASEGTYYYVIQIQTQTGLNKQEKGFVQLIR